MPSKRKSKASEKREKEPGSDKGAVDTAADAFERALSEFFVSPDDLEGLEAGAPDIHLAAPGPSAREALHEYLSFRLADEQFAVSILYIKEIIKPSIFTSLPRTDPVVLGILSLRGTIVPVVDLRLLLGLEEQQQTRSSRILIVNSGGEQIGLLVDEVRHVIRLRDEDIEPTPAVFGRSEMEHMLGVGRYDGEMFTLVDLQAVVQLERLVHNTPGGQLL